MTEDADQRPFVLGQDSLGRN